jgi:hypothetical protein
VSRKSVPFSMAAKRPAPDVVLDAHSDDWVSDRHARGQASSTGTAPSFILDLAAERGLAEVLVLSLIAPFALGSFWLLNAMAGRVRF